MKMLESVIPFVKRVGGTKCPPPPSSLLRNFENIEAMAMRLGQR